MSVIESILNGKSARDWIFYTKDEFSLLNKNQIAEYISLISHEANLNPSDEGYVPIQNQNDFKVIQ